MSSIEIAVEGLHATVNEIEQFLLQTNKNEDLIKHHIKSLDEDMDFVTSIATASGQGFCAQFIDARFDVQCVRRKLERELIRIRALINSSLRIDPMLSSLNTSSTLPDFLNSIKKEDTSIRRRLYLHWSNSKEVKMIFLKMYHLITEYFDKHSLKFEDELPERDILELLMEQSVLKESVEVHNTDIELKVNDFPISNPILISERILSDHRRSTASSCLKQIGYQHVYLHPDMRDSSNISSSASSTEDGSANSDSTKHVSKKRKVCQMACLLNLDNQLSSHQENSSFIKGTPARVDTLLLIPDASVCHHLAIHLGFIYIEDIIHEANCDADNAKILQNNLANPNAKTYRMIQAYVNQLLMFGSSNVCMTGNKNIFKIVLADVKASFLKKTDETSYFDIQEFCHMEVTVPKEATIIHYLTGIGEIFDRILRIESSVKVLYCITDRNYLVKVPLFSMIPMYILKFFSQVLVSRSISNLKFSDV